MTRKKVKLVWIASDNARKASYKKRRVGLMKKVSELTTLCGVYAFAVVNGPDDDQPTIWPSRPIAQQLLRRYQSLPELERQKKMTNQETYLKERTAKVQDNLKKVMKKNQELEMSLLMHQLNQGRKIYDFTNSDLLGLLWMVEEKIKEARKRIEYQLQVNRIPPPPPHTTENETDPMETGGGDGDGDGEGDGDRRNQNVVDQWFIDMVMNSNSNEKIGGSSSSMMGEIGLGFQSEGNEMLGFGDFGGRQGDEMMSFGGEKLGEGLGGDSSFMLSQWNFGGTSSTGISEIEKLIGNINGVDDAISPMDFTQGNFEIGGCVGSGGDGGEDHMGMGMFSCGGGGDGAGVGDTTKNDGIGIVGSDGDLFHGLFGDGINENDVFSKGWSSIFTP